MRSYAKIILLLLIPMALVVGYALSSLEIGSGDVMLEQADLSGVRRLFPMFFAESDETPPSSPSQIVPRDTIVPIDTIALIDTIAPTDTTTQDSLPTPPKEEPIEEIKVHKPDFSKYRIMIFGDSMLEWLAKRLCDYSLENGYDLSSIIWYSSSTKLWHTAILPRSHPARLRHALPGRQ